MLSMQYAIAEHAAAVEVKAAVLLKMGELASSAQHHQGDGPTPSIGPVSTGKEQINSLEEKLSEEAKHRNNMGGELAMMKQVSHDTGAEAFRLYAWRDRGACRAFRPVHVEAHWPKGRRCL